VPDCFKRVPIWKKGREMHNLTVACLLLAAFISKLFRYRKKYRAECTVHTRGPQNKR
jgi:hypothetical protein